MSREQRYGRRDYDQIPLDERIVCKFCKKIVHKDAKACPYCSQFFNLGHEIRRPAILISLISCFIGYLGLGFAYLQYQETKKAKAETADANFKTDQAHGVIEDTKAAAGTPLGAGYSFETIGPKKEQELIQRNFSKAPKKIVDVIKTAFALKNDSNVGFKWGGKSPEEGFDSSGFAAYVLAQNGLLDKVGYRLYNTTRLKAIYLSVPIDQIIPGDLIIYKSGFVAFFLGEKHGIGIGNSKGIQVVNLDFSKVDGIYRWSNS